MGQSGSTSIDAAGAGEVGATIATEYVSRNQTATVIDVEDLHEFQASMTEEFWQYSLGTFLTAGSFWLGIERAFTAPVWHKDVLFWLCVFAFIAGLVIGAAAYRQMSRRKTKIGKIIQAAEDSAKARTVAATSSAVTSIGAT